MSEQSEFDDEGGADGHEVKLAPTEKDRDEAREKHKRLYSVSARGYELLFRGPTRTEWKRFMDAVSGSQEKKYAASTTLFGQCRVWPKYKSPEYKALEAAYEDEPQIETAHILNFVEIVQDGFEGEGKKVETPST